MKKWHNFLGYLPFIRIYQFLSAIGLVFLLLFGTFNIVAYDRASAASVDPQLVGNDMVSRWDRMMRKLVPDLPAHGVVGYLADWDIPGYAYGNSDQTVEYLLTQYSLAPLTLARGAKYPLVVGNFSDTGDPRKIEKALEYFHLRVAKQHTNEIYLLEGQAQ